MPATCVLEAAHPSATGHPYRVQRDSYFQVFEAHTVAQNVNKGKRQTRGCATGRDVPLRYLNSTRALQCVESPSRPIVDVLVWANDEHQAGLVLIDHHVDSPRDAGVKEGELQRADSLQISCQSVSTQGIDRQLMDGTRCSLDVGRKPLRAFCASRASWML